MGKKRNKYSNLLGRYFSDFDCFLFDGYTYLSQKEMFLFMSKLMINLVVTGQGLATRQLYTLRGPGQLPVDAEEFASYLASGQDVLTHHFDNLEEQWGGGLGKVHGYTDDELRIFLRKDSMAYGAEDGITKKRKRGKKLARATRDSRAATALGPETEKVLVNLPAINSTNDREGGMDYLLTLERSTPPPYPTHHTYHRYQTHSCCCC